MKVLLAILLLASLVGCKSTSNLKVVSGFEPDRYLGTWYEVARYPHRFEKNLSSVSAQYARNEDGTIKVTNRGYNDSSNEWETIDGVAKLKGDSDSGWLKVSFFKPFYASYKIIHLDDEYTQAIVTGPTYGYLWILSRSPALDDAEMELLVTQTERFGFDRDKLIIVNQKKNIK